MKTQRKALHRCNEEQIKVNNPEKSSSLTIWACAYGILLNHA